MSPSRLHSYLEGKFAAAFALFPQFMTYINLTLDIGGVDYIPDVCVYPQQPVNFFAPDSIRMAEMPIMAIEIVSPTQVIQDVLEKFPIYFQAGIQSCWLVIPAAQTVSVYASPTQAQVFTAPGELTDPMLNIRIPLAQIFA